MVDKEIDPRDLASIKRAVQRTVERMAHHLLSVQFSETRERMELTLNHNDFDLTPEQRAEASTTGAYRQLMSLAAAAYSRDEGLIRVGKALSAASRFFQSNGMAYRLLEREQSTTAERRKKGAALIRNEEVLCRLTLWTTPMLTDNTAAIGTQSMRCADRDALRDAAGMFFDSGVRCQWFEKMLLQALVAAELHGCSGATSHYLERYSVTGRFRCRFAVRDRAELHLESVRACRNPVAARINDAPPGSV